MLSILLFCSIPGVAQQKITDSLEQILTVHPSDTVAIDVLSKIAVEYFRTDFEKAQTLLHRAIAIARRLNTTHGLSAIYSQLATSHHNSGNADSAFYYLEKLEDLARENPTFRNQTNYFFTAGLIYKNTGNYRIAIDFMQKALKLAEAPEYQINRAGLLLNIGNTYSGLGEITSAAEYHIQALELFETLENLRGQSFCLQGLGNDFLELREYESAIKYFNRSLAIKQNQKDYRGLVTVWSGLGQVNREMNNQEESKAYFTKALQQARQLKLTREETKILYEYGLLEKAWGHRTQATRILKQGLDLAESGRDTLSIAEFKAELASMNFGQTSGNQTENTLLDKIETASGSEHKDMVADGHEEIALWYAGQNQYKEAYEHLLRYNRLNDRLKGSHVIMQLKTLEKKYETEKKENEISLLKKDQAIKNAIIAKQQSHQILVVLALLSIIVIAGLLINRYRLVNRTKRQLEIEHVRNTIARDLHDDIGSTLSSINIISKVALQENDNATQHFQRIFKNSALMMENMADIVWSIHPNNDSVEKIVIRIKEFAAEILEPLGITYTIQIPGTIKNIRLDVAQRKSLFLIFKEAINNVAKYSEASEATIAITLKGKSIVLVVSDNGKGFNVSQAKSGNGLKNMEARAHDLRGALTKTSTEDGTVIQLIMPVT